MKKSILVLLAICFSANAFAAVAPFYKSKREVEAILVNQDLAKKLGMSSIKSIQRTDNSKYFVQNQNCAVNVVVEHETPPPGLAGEPGIKKVVISNPICRAAAPAPRMVAPVYYTINEIRAIISTDKLAALGGFINAIVGTELNKYKVTVGNCAVNAVVEYVAHGNGVPREPQIKGVKLSRPVCSR